METHSLSTYIANFIAEHGVPQVLDVDHSILVHKPTLTGSDSPASYYIRPPDGMSADSFIEWFESIPGVREFRLTLVPILGIDTYHQPLISSDDFAGKYFRDNQFRYVRVVGKSDNAIAAMVAFVEALKRPFDSNSFPHHGEFSVSAYRAAEKGRASELKLLYMPADHTQLMKIERLVSVHLDEWNLGREIVASRHATRDQAPELILASTSDAATGVAFLEALAHSLPRATPEEIAEATDAAKRATVHAAPAPSIQARFVQPQAPTVVFTLEELKRRAIANLADVMRASRFAGGSEVKVIQAGTTIEVEFPRSISSLWLTTTFNKGKHIIDVANSCVGVRVDPSLRKGWSAVYNYDSKTGKLHIRAVETGAEPPSGWKLVPYVD